MRLRGHVSLKQSDFGMQPYTAMLGAIGVADQLELYGEAYIVKEGNIPPPVAPAGRRGNRIKRLLLRAAGNYGHSTGTSRISPFRQKGPSLSSCQC